MRYKRTPLGPQIPGLLCVYDKHGVCDFAQVDVDDWERLAHHRFTLIANGYPATRIGDTRTYLHHLVLGPMTRESKRTVDHMNRDKLDNRRANLRIVTQEENLHNRGGIHERCWARRLVA